MTNPTPTDLDALMLKLGAEVDEALQKDPLLVTPRDIDLIIAYQRKHRAQVESGGSKRAKRTDGPKASISGLLDRMIAKPAGGEGTVKRRM